MDTYLVA